MDFGSRDAQQYLLDFCRAARASSWFHIGPDDPTYSGTPVFPHNCTIERLIFMMEMPCATTPGYRLSGPCCGVASADFPYDPTLFTECLGELAIYSARGSAVSPQAQAPTSGLSFWALTNAGSGAWFDSSTGEVKVLTMLFPTDETYSNVHSTTHAWLNGMEEWSSERLVGAPPGMKGGFLTVPYSSLGYYALQTGLAQSSQAAMFIAIGFALGILTFVTMNFIVALYTTLTVALIVLCVTGILIFGLGWEQGLMESIIISCGIGMACDFAAHLGFAYRQANFKKQADNRAALVEIAITRMAPALTFAAFSTLVMGVMMCFSGTLFTLRFGIFISLLMVRPSLACHRTPCTSNVHQRKGHGL
jgi:hypothetical protein